MKTIDVTWNTKNKDTGDYTAIATISTADNSFGPMFGVFEILPLDITPPSAASSSATGAPKDTYCTNENVYAAGSGFTSTNVDIHVVQDQDWNDGDPIPPDITGAVETVSVNDGEIAPVLVWHALLVLGEYDIAIDANRNRVYDAATDGLDSGSPGFIVVADATIPAGVPVPALTPHGIAALVGLLCVIGVSRVRRRFN